MATTMQNNAWPVREDTTGSQHDGKAFNSTESDDSGSDFECGRSLRKTQSGLIKLSRTFSPGSTVTPPKWQTKMEPKTFDAKVYLDKRVMTPMQERFNAVTMLPGVIYTFYFVLVGCWVAPGDQQNEFRLESGEWVGVAREVFRDDRSWIGNIGCIKSQLFPDLTALPPWPVLAAAFGAIIHPPFSMVYHWKYATSIASSDRIKHWSRRLDHASIHIASAAASYATSGRMDYFILNALFNLDCACRQFEERVHPRRNIVRIALSILLYTLPVLVYGHYTLYLQFAIMFIIGGWLFVTYPFAGWSHSLFHLVLTFLPHLVITAAMQLESSQPQMNLAVKCAALAD